MMCDVMDPGANADHFLVEQIRTGSEPAWRQLIDRYTGRLLAFARARTASLSDAEDLVQEAFVGFLQSLGHYDPSRPLETYLFTILRSDRARHHGDAERGGRAGRGTAAAGNAAGGNTPAAHQRAA
jgi:RNA polymerase sigma-70 factor (ECF subfamily)